MKLKNSAVRFLIEGLAEQTILNGRLKNALEKEQADVGALMVKLASAEKSRDFLVGANRNLAARLSETDLGGEQGAPKEGR